MTFRELLNSTLSTGISKLAAVSGGLYLQYLLTNNLSVSDVGIFVVIITFLTAVSVSVRYGLDTVLMRYGGVYYCSDEFERFASLISSTRRYVIRRGVTAILLAVSVIFVLQYAGIDGLPLTPLLSSIWVIPFYSLLIPIAAIYRAKNQSYLAPLWEQGGVSLSVSLLLLLVWSFVTPNLWHALIVFYVVTVIMVLHIFRAKKGMIDVNLSDFNGRGDYGATQVSAFLTQWGVVLVMAVMGNVDDVAYLGTALRVALVISFIRIVLNGILASRFAALYEAGREGEFKQLAKRSTLMMCVVAAFPASLLLLAPEWLLGWFGERYIVAVPLLMILTVSQFYNVSSGPVMLVLNMTGNQRYVRNIVVISGLVSLILVGPVVYLGGALHAAMLIAVLSISSNTAALVVMRKRLGFTTLPI